jgi:hypothetical protein
MNRGDWQRLLHMRTYCEDIAKFIDRFGDDFQIFTADKAYFNAVSMCILQIGELANGLSDEFRPDSEGKDTAAFLVRRMGARQKIHTGNESAEGFVRLDSEAHVPHVQGIERAAENGDAVPGRFRGHQDRTCPEPRTTNLLVVSSMTPMGP